MDAEVPLLKNWVTADGGVCSDVAEQIKNAPNGTIFVLENTRQNDIERVLWKATPVDLPALAEPLAKFANECAEKLATVYVNEAFSAGSLDASSTVVPAAMQCVALGRYLEGQFSGPMMECLKTQLVVFSGLKIDKLDDLEAMMSRGKIKMVLAAGSLAMVLRKAIAEIDGTECCIGLAEDPAHKDKPYYIPAERIAQAKAMVLAGRKNGVDFVVPVDSVIEDGSTVDVL